MKWPQEGLPRNVKVIYYFIHQLLGLGGGNWGEHRKTGLTQLFIDLWFLCSPFWGQLSVDGTSKSKSLCCQCALSCAGQEEASVHIGAEIQNK